MASTDKFLLECAACRCKINLSVESGRFAGQGPDGSGGIAPDGSFLIVGQGTHPNFSTGEISPHPTLERPSQNASATRPLDESFIVLDSAAMPSSSSSSNKELEAPADLLRSQLRSLTALFELAASESQTDQPLCLDCAKALYGELKSQLQEAEREVLAYREAVQELRQAAPPLAVSPPSAPRSPLREGEGGEGGASTSEAPSSASARSPRSPSPLPAPDPRQALRDELRQLLQEEDKERKRLLALEKDYGAALDELRTLEGESLRLDQLEDAYWRELNRFQHELQRHVEERDGTLAKVDRARHHLESLRKTNVFNDVFRIWYDGHLGTISGFRLGRTPQVQVPWEEINSALGQCVLLLQALASACRLEFSGVRLLPMASRSRIEERGRTLDLFGPVNKVNIISGFDQGLVCFLECLKQLADFLRSRDLAAGKAPDEAFALSYAIEGDRVGGASIRFCMNKDQKWTKALKFMLADLKLCLNNVASARAEGAGDREGSTGTA